MRKVLKQSITCIVILITVASLASFIDFMDYWTVKINGKVVFDSSKDLNRNSNEVFHYTVFLNKLSSSDTIEVNYITDTRCFNCICTYFISEHDERDGFTSNDLHTYLREQKSLGEKPYKLSIGDLCNAGTKGTNKAIYYYANSSAPMELCYIEFK